MLQAKKFLCSFGFSDYDNPGYFEWSVAFLWFISFQTDMLFFLCAVWVLICFLPPPSGLAFRLYRTMLKFITTMPTSWRTGDETKKPFAIIKQPSGKCVCVCMWAWEQFDTEWFCLLMEAFPVAKIHLNTLVSFIFWLRISAFIWLCKSVNCLCVLYRLYPRHASALNNLGTLTQQTEEAEVYYRRALDINPQHNRALFNLGNLLK